MARIDFTKLAATLPNSEEEEEEEEEKSSWFGR